VLHVLSGFGSDNDCAAAARFFIRHILVDLRVAESL
jgi:hypothetical protein